MVRCCRQWERGEAMDALAEILDTKLRTWKTETAAEVRDRVAEVIALADDDLLDVMRSRAMEQEVLDLLDEPPTR
jgi:hypothetical protein